MTCGAIQNESRPMPRCQRMSQPTPQPPTSLAATSAQSAHRRMRVGNTRNVGAEGEPQWKDAPALDVDACGRPSEGRDTAMPSDEARRVLNLFSVAVTSLEDAIDNRAPLDEVIKWDREVAERTRETLALVERLRSRRIA